ncbi:MAG: sugar phosphate isomerase/epimerase [Deltaproteobacteria bacterium]|jgi:sugar phosphate isomerase/epimerase|nr:sugar phosphate isomerase/epimerase [Deltaproteobacteria bacterium]
MTTQKVSPPTTPPPNQIFASLTLDSLDPANPGFQLLQKLGLWPELSFESSWSKLSPDQFREKAKIVSDHFPGAAVHLPYGGLDFGRGDNFLEKKDRLLQATELAELFAPTHLIGHPNFQSLSDSVLGQKKYAGFKRGNLQGPSQTPAQWWLDRSISVWSAVLAVSSAQLRLENTYEHSPEPILILLHQLGERAGFCLDLGHWFYYAMGRHWDNLDFWLTQTATKLAHAHVHDNNGEGDQHRPLGQGLINYGRVRQLLAEKELRPPYTIENHRPQDLRASFNELTQNPLWRETDLDLERKVS